MFFLAYDEYDGLTFDKCCKASNPLFLRDVSISFFSRMLPVKVFEYPDKWNFKCHSLTINMPIIVKLYLIVTVRPAN